MFMRDVAHLLSVRIEQEFLGKENGFLFKFRKDGLYIYEEPSGNWKVDNHALRMFLAGELTVEPIMEPHNAERRLYVKRESDHKETMCHFCERLDDKIVNHLAYMKGSRPRSKEEAERLRSEIIPLCCCEEACCKGIDQHSDQH